MTEMAGVIGFEGAQGIIFLVWVVQSCVKQNLPLIKYCSDYYYYYCCSTFLAAAHFWIMFSK